MSKYGYSHYSKDVREGEYVAQNKSVIGMLIGGILVIVVAFAVLYVAAVLGIF